MKKYKIDLDLQVLIITIFSLLWVTFYKIYFLSINEIFPHAYELSEIVYGVLGSIIASGIFYYFVVYLDMKKKRNIINKIALKRLQSIRVGLFLIQNDTFPIFGLKYDDEIPEMDEFLKICKGIDLGSPAPAISNTTMKNITWHQYFEIYFQSDKYNSKILYEHLIYLDIHLIELLDEIQFSHFERALNSFKENGITSQISGAAGPFWLYLKSLEKISIYCTRLEKKYQDLQIQGKRI